MRRNKAESQEKLNYSPPARNRCAQSATWKIQPVALHW
jgi:hypothetical protein